MIEPRLCVLHYGRTRLCVMHYGRTPVWHAQGIRFQLSARRKESVQVFVIDKAYVSYLLLMKDQRCYYRSLLCDRGIARALCFCNGLYAFFFFFVSAFSHGSRESMMMKNVVALDLEVATQALANFPGNPMRRLLLVPWRLLLTGFTVLVRRNNTGSGKPQTVVSLALAVVGGVCTLTFTWNSNEPPLSPGELRFFSRSQQK